MLKGKRLKPGDTIGLIGPSGAVRKEGAVDRAIAYMQELGYKVKVKPMQGEYIKLCAWNF